MRRIGVLWIKSGGRRPPLPSAREGRSERAVSRGYVLHELGETGIAACDLPSPPPDVPVARLLKWSSTNSRIAEERLPCWRLLSISPTSSESVMLRSPEISFMPFQNASSRLTLVLWPATTIDRFTTGDFMRPPRRRSDADRVVRAPARSRLPRARVRS